MNYSPADTPMPEGQESQDTDIAARSVLIQSKNLAKGLSKEKLLEISEQCHRGFEADLDSRSDWEADLDSWIALANQIREEKSFPWSNSSNVKYPLLSTAAMQFAARAYPALVPANRQIVSCTVVGSDPTGQKVDKATRVSKFMSYQLLEEIPGWEEDMDKLLIMLPITGMVFKKTWYDRSDDVIKSQLVLPKNLVVNYWIKSLSDCERITEIIPLSPRLLKERQLTGLYLDVELNHPMPENASNSSYTTQDETTPFELLEQHTFLDMDDDGYPEPYIVTMERSSKKILRIQSRFRPEDVTMDEKGKKIVKIKPIQMYTKFPFIPNPDGSFYDIGFGVLLGPLNESVNTTINQLIDSGTLNTLQSGFIGKAIKLRMGDNGFQPGEWKPVNATGDDLRKQIVPLPTKEPSAVLFQLMGTLITSGKELASVAEIFVGKMPGQNTPATTTMASIEQGMKVFTAVYKRIFRSLKEEYWKIFDLNKLYINPNHVVEVLDMQVGPEDFDRSTCDLSPGADPTAMSQTEKLMKAQGLVESMQIFGQLMDPIEVASRVFQAQEQPNWQQLFNKQVQESGQLPPPPPDPKLMAIQAKMQADQMKAQSDVQQKQFEMELEARDRTMKLQMSQQEHAQKMQQQSESARVKAASDIQMANIFASQARAKTVQDVVHKEQTHQQAMQQNQEKAKSAQETKSKSGKSTR